MTCLSRSELIRLTADALTVEELLAVKLHIDSCLICALEAEEAKGVYASNLKRACASVREKFPDYVRRRLSARLSQVMRAHLLLCSECLDLWIDFVNIKNKEI